MSEEIIIDGKKISELSDMFFEYIKQKREVERLEQRNKELDEECSHKSNLIWYIYHCNKVETIQQLLHEYYECINGGSYSKERIEKFWHDIFHFQTRKKHQSKYKQALEEIREQCFYECRVCGDCETDKECFEPCKKFQDSILGKINEVLNDRD